MQENLWMTPSHRFHLRYQVTTQPIRNRSSQLSPGNWPIEDNGPTSSFTRVTMSPRIKQRWLGAHYPLPGLHFSCKNSWVGRYWEIRPRKIQCISPWRFKKRGLLVYTVAPESRFMFIHWFCLWLTAWPWESHLISMCLRICIKIIIIADVLWEKTATV